MGYESLEEIIGKSSLLSLKSDYLTEANALDLSVLQERFRPNKTQSNTIRKNNIKQVLTEDSLTKKILSHLHMHYDHSILLCRKGINRKVLLLDVSN